MAPIYLEGDKGEATLINAARKNKFKLIMKTKSNILVLILFSLAIIGCTSDEIPAPNDMGEQEIEKLDFKVVDFDLKQIKNVKPKELIAFFGLKSSDNLVALKKVASETKQECDVLMLIDKEYVDSPEDAPEAIYVDDYGQDPYLTYLLNKNKTNDNKEIVKIFNGLEESATFIIEYDLEKETINLITSRKNFEACLDSCIHSELDKIFNNSSAFRQALFVMRAAGEFAEIVVDCSGQCANIW